MFHVNRDEFVYALTVAKGFAGKDNATPILAAVRLTGRGEYLVATATDRYKLVESRASVVSGAADFDAVIPVSMVPTVIAAIKASPKILPVEVERVSMRSVRVCGVEVMEVEGNYPDVRRLWPDELPEGGTFAIADGKVFGLLKPRDRNPVEPLGVFPQLEGNGAVVALRGDHTRALVMPVREAGDPQQAWADWQATSAAGEVAR